MKGPVTLSSLAHVTILAWGLLSFSGPKPLVVADVEALPIDIVPISEITNSVQGEKKADFTDKPAPTPTQRPQTLPEARNVGETELDARSERPPEPTPKPSETQRADAPPPAPEPTPASEVKPEPAVEPDAPEPTPTTELAALSEPPSPVNEEPEAQAPPEAAESAESFEAPPENVPVPERRPQPPKTQSAETNERKKPEEKPRAKQTAAAQSQSKSTEDEIAALLNKEQPSASGAKRSTEQASLGTRRPGTGEKLSQTEMDALRGAIERCWSVPSGLADAENMRVTITMRLTRDGEIEGAPQVEATGGEDGARRAFAGSARRAVLACAPYQLPPEKYETWADVVVNFDPSQLF